MIVLDSSFLIAWRNDRDAHHAAAGPAMRKVAAGTWGPALLPEYVLVETVTVLAARRGLEEGAGAAVALLGSQELEFVPCSPFFARALDFFRTQRGTALSLTDAAIVAIARARGATRVGTFDRDFAKVPGLALVPS